VLRHDFILFFFGRLLPHFAKLLRHLRERQFCTHIHTHRPRSENVLVGAAQHAYNKPGCSARSRGRCFRENNKNNDDGRFGKVGFLAAAALAGCGDCGGPALLDAG